MWMKEYTINIYKYIIVCVIGLSQLSLSQVLDPNNTIKVFQAFPHLRSFLPSREII